MVERKKKAIKQKKGKMYPVLVIKNLAELNEVFKKE
jgi:hypothetical protein